MGTVVQGDSAELQAYLRLNGVPVTANQISEVQFTVQLPDNTQQTVEGTIQPDGSGFYRWLNTDQTGAYTVQAQFFLTSGEIRSLYYDFDVIDPFNPPDPTATDLIVEQVWLRLEDLFDSVDGGPYLREVTHAHFDASKIADFIPEALLDINVQMPPTQFTLNDFTVAVATPGQASVPNPAMPLLVKGVLILVIRHLMRSYVEQPIPQGGQVVWHDRTRYVQLWTQIYQTEYADYIQAVRLFKRTQYGFGHMASLVFSKAGRLYPYGSMRSRGVWRGYY
jgi:hypothetical protein